MCIFILQEIVKDLRSLVTSLADQLSLHPGFGTAKYIILMDINAHVHVHASAQSFGSLKQMLVKNYKRLYLVLMIAMENYNRKDNG